MDHLAKESIELRLASIATKLPIEVQVTPEIVKVLHAAYMEGRLDGAMATAQMIAEQRTASQDDNQSLRSERMDRFARDLSTGRRCHPDIDFDKPFKLHGTIYTIVGYNVRAPSNPFLIKGPQGGIYKCTMNAVWRGQQP